jgi:hypothetical protein
MIAIKICQHDSLGESATPETGRNLLDHFLALNHDFLAQVQNRVSLEIPGHEDSEYVFQIYSAMSVNKTAKLNV